ncbi:hypothetical protein NEUTE1DRAFT_106645 [Neurospora tetrasperma FGSC 2508]|uniref:Uncharacterized protein n=1 Tax=Neurospora tetrasperma (strain FGSC 2508 / ATCC MYA-4615 / P0657) TaxID=510951 RepID=F8N036_NEUT8|nr:uncharacterized protein NEUTE1DRAFT_106645 [Neurospora tetrasperma FGSC 2508]EGO53771.1 hypothetical protein NEUTE1DRAFT_106645 [Neurospora tetrasperma FGSC 2508]EGZ76147.1 hypothetical protein NEUTE2DRAFT_122802 [Neurospora tetrasperma FGSC 2509]
MLLYAVYVDGSCSMFRLSEAESPSLSSPVPALTLAPALSSLLPFARPVVLLPLPLPFPLENINLSSLKLRLR